MGIRDGGRPTYDMVIVLVVVMQIFEKVKEQLLKWTID